MKLSTIETTDERFALMQFVLHAGWSDEPVTLHVTPRGWELRCDSGGDPIRVLARMEP